MAKRLKASSKGHIYTKKGKKFGFDLTLDTTREIDPKDIGHLASHFPGHFEDVEDDATPDKNKAPEPSAKNVKEMTAEIKASTDVEALKAMRVGEERGTVLTAIEKRLKELETTAPDKNKAPEPTGSERTKFAAVEAEKAAEAEKTGKGEEDADDDDLNDDDLDEK